MLSGASGEVVGAFPLDRRTLQEAFDWLGSRLKGFGLDPAPLAHPIHFELDDHRLLHGCRFEFSGRERLFEELARWYGNAALCVSAISSPVQCWPHHFDIATQIAIGERPIGVGLSPGDANYSLISMSRRGRFWTRTACRDWLPVNGTPRGGSARCSPRTRSFQRLIRRDS